MSTLEQNILSARDEAYADREDTIYESELSALLDSIEGFQGLVDEIYEDNSFELIDMLQAILHNRAQSQDKLRKYLLQEAQHMAFVRTQRAMDAMVAEGIAGLEEDWL